MICKNCGLDNLDSSKFCAGCGQKLEISNVPQNNVPQNNVPQNNVPQNNVPQNNVPQNNVPQNNVPQNSMPNNYVPQYNNYQNQVPNQSMVDPITGQPISNKKKFDFKKRLPLIIGIAGGVVAIIVAIVVVFSVVNNSGINGVLNKLEDGINNKNPQSIQKCFPEFMVKDEDINLDNVKSYLFSDDEADYEVEFEVEKERDITDELYDSKYTWKESLQEYYESQDDYDGGEVQEVKEVTVDMDLDSKNKIVDYLDDYLDDNTKYLTLVKYDGSWYIFDLD